MCRNEWSNVCLSLLEKSIPVYVCSVFSCVFTYRFQQEEQTYRSDTQKCICTTRNCLSDFLHKLWETSRISAIIFQLWNVLLKSDYNFSCIELFVVPYCYHMLCPFFCSSAVLWIVKHWTVFLSPNYWPAHFKTARKFLQCSNFMLDSRLRAL